VRTYLLIKVASIPTLFKSGAPLRTTLRGARCGRLGDHPIHQATEIGDSQDRSNQREDEACNSQWWRLGDQSAEENKDSNDDEAKTRNDSGTTGGLAAKRRNEAGVIGCKSFFHLRQETFFVLRKWHGAHNSRATELWKVESG